MKLYNTLSRQIEDFVPYDREAVTMYTCGPTVYNYAHIGNLRTYIHEDILEKTLKYVGFNVVRCMNITDVGHLESDEDSGDDKMLKGAIRENLTVWEVASRYTDAFFNDIDRLNLQRPEIVEKATDHIDDYINYIKVLDEKGFTYFAGGNVYFDISKFPEYNKLSKMPLEDLKIAHRDDVEVDENKKNPHDFVLWFTKSKFENQAMKWDSPWGVGYPGWHIECSVIAIKSLGANLDIHCGGVDHITVHHTNEIAQSESYLGHDWCKYWWHGEFLVDNTGKMSKSKGEFLTINLLVEKGYDPLAYKYYVLNSHYRKQLPFTYDRLDDAVNAYVKLRGRCSDILVSEMQKCGVDSAESLFATYDSQGLNINNLSENGSDLRAKFKEMVEDDLNTANAITVLYDVLKADISDSEKLILIKDFDFVLSLKLTEVYEVKTGADDASEDFIAWIESKIEERLKAKSEKNWAVADAIRNELSEKGVTLKDTKDGSTYEIA